MEIHRSCAPNQLKAPLRSLKFMQNKLLAFTVPIDVIELRPTFTERLTLKKYKFEIDAEMCFTRRFRFRLPEIKKGQKKRLEWKKQHFHC